MSQTLPILDRPSDADLYKCVHCGLCLNSCPTYLELGLETESPRGRIALMRAVHEGRTAITKNVIGHWEMCLQCRACEAACPSGVPYGRLMEAARNQTEAVRRRSILGRMLYRLVYRLLMPRQRRLETLAAALRLYQRSGLQWLVRRSRLLKVVYPKLGAMEQSLPPISSRFFRASGQIVPARGKKRATVAILSGCVMPLVHGPTMDSAVRVLTVNGCDVLVTAGQGCCGALNSHSGDLDGARQMARRNIDAFLPLQSRSLQGEGLSSPSGDVAPSLVGRSPQVDAIVVASAGCGAAMKEYDYLLKDDPTYADKARKFSRMVKDIHEYLVSLPLRPPTSRLDIRVTYQDSCHLAHAQRIKDAPRDILAAIPGVQLVEMAHPAKCCGAAGSYTVTQRDFSQRLLESKMAEVAATNAQVITTANPGCVLQLQSGVRQRGLDMQATYVVDLLAQAYARES